MRFKRLISQNTFSPSVRLALLLAFTGVLLLMKGSIEQQKLPYVVSFTGISDSPGARSSTYLLERDEKMMLQLIPSGHSKKKLLVQMTSNYPLRLQTSSTNNTIFDKYELSASAPACKPTLHGYTCDLFESTSNIENKSITFIAQKDGTTIHLNQVQHLTTSHITKFGSNHYLFLLALLILPLPILWLIHHRSKIVSQWLIISVATASLSLIQPVFTIVLLGFLYGMFSFGKYFFARETSYLGFTWLAIGLSLFFLIQGKYSSHMLHTLFPQYGNTNIGIPLGISYFVIRLIDTLLSWRRGENQNISFREFLCYIIFPPTVPAGPIDTLSDFQANRLEKFTKEDFVAGVGRIIIGIFKKVVIASYMIAPLVSQLFGEVVTHSVVLTPSYQTVLFLFFSFLYAYIDFSAYSDIAIGASRLYGYRMIENFTWPILAHNLHEYWRSWHRSLSLWCFRNVYFPLTIKTRNTYIPLYVTMATVGLWHVFGLPWFTWALYHASGLSLLTFLQRKKIKLISRPLLRILAHPLKILFTLIFVAGGYSFVVFDNFYLAGRVFLIYWATLFSFGAA